VAEVLSPQALCSLADAQAAGTVGTTGSAASADEWTRKINAASVAFLNLSGREFVSNDATRAGNGTLNAIPNADRVFSARELVKIAADPFELELGDVATVTTVTLGFYVDGTTRVLGASEWLPLPRRRRFPWEPIEALELGPNVCLSSVRDTITVNAKWGFPAVPEDVREAVARAAAAWITQDVRRYGEVFSAAEQTAPADASSAHVLPRFAWETAMRYRRQRF
jgi:hypothetical protein